MKKRNVKRMNNAISLRKLNLKEIASFIRNMSTRRWTISNIRYVLTRRMVHIYF